MQPLLFYSNTRENVTAGPVCVQANKKGVSAIDTPFRI
jgi:hypothetical protein